MAQFDASKTVNNILSGGGDTAQALVGNVIRTAADLANLPGVDVAKLPGLGTAVGAATGVFGGPKSQAPKPKQVPKREFNPFDPRAARAATVMASKLMEIAERKGGDAGVADAVGALGSLGELVGQVTGLAGNLVTALTDEVSEIVGAVGEDMLGMIGLRQRALELFITHYPAAREKFTVEPLSQRQPNLVSRSGALATPKAENAVSYWREDAQLNDHHGHWHLVNPLGGRLRPGATMADPADMGNRHGELFAYMHEQMLARYDAERLGVGLSRVKPFDDYTERILEGYDPGNLMAWKGEEWVGFGARPSDADKLKNFEKNAPNEYAAEIPGALISNLTEFRARLLKAAQQGQYELAKGKPTLTSDNFGNTVEANALSVDGKQYGNLHGDGHAHFAFFNSDPKALAGVMMNLDVTVRDPIFWRWHKNVDAIIQAWRQTLGKRQPHDFADGPQVTVRSEDIIVCRKEGLPADFDGVELGAEAFGYAEEPNQWDIDFSSSTVTLSNGKTVTTTAELMTEMRSRTIQIHDPAGEKSDKSDKKLTEEIDYLSHEDFFYFLRLENRSPQAQKVTIRIFLVPEPWVDDHTAWIEMDRFLHQLNAGERAVVFRPARLSAVIRKPALGHEELESTEQRDSTDNWCDCGWPYTLLLPRSTKEGSDFRLLVMVSSGEDLRMTDTGEECTSMSYCGLKDKDYPDNRPMGYPFDRALADSIPAIINKHDNWASRTIRIRCRNPK